MPRCRPDPSRGDRDSKKAAVDREIKQKAGHMVWIFIMAPPVKAMRRKQTLWGGFMPPHVVVSD